MLPSGKRGAAEDGGGWSRFRQWHPHRDQGAAGGIPTPWPACAERMWALNAPWYLKDLNHVWAELWRGHCTRRVGQSSALSLPSCWGCAAGQSEGRQECSGMALRWVIPWEEWGWSPPVGQLWSRSSQHCQVTPQRFCISVYLCCSERAPCHWDRKQLWTEISASDGNVSSVMLFHIFF